MFFLFWFLFLINWLQDYECMKDKKKEKRSLSWQQHYLIFSISANYAYRDIVFIFQDIIAVDSKRRSVRMRYEAKANSLNPKWCENKYIGNRKKRDGLLWLILWSGILLWATLNIFSLIFSTFTAHYRIT